MNIIKENKWIFIIGFIILGFIFYWYSFRPMSIKKECYNIGAYGTNNKKSLKFLTSENAVDSDNLLFKKDYQNCLYRNGIK